MAAGSTAGACARTSVATVADSASAPSANNAAAILKFNVLILVSFSGWFSRAGGACPAAGAPVRSARTVTARRPSLIETRRVIMQRPELADTETAAADADAVEAGPDAAADPDPVDEQRGRAATGGHRAV